MRASVIDVGYWRRHNRQPATTHSCDERVCFRPVHLQPAESESDLRQRRPAWEARYRADSIIESSRSNWLNRYPCISLFLAPHCVVKDMARADGGVLLHCARQPCALSIFGLQGRAGR